MEYTPEDLIMFLYKESSTELTAAIEDQLAKDWTLREKMSVLKASHERLNTIVEAPRTQVVLNILKYAGKTETVRS
ncbi:MAG: hypothetical protein ABIN57_01485 [Chitinophagaceae bacterium]